MCVCVAGRGVRQAGKREHSESDRERDTEREREGGAENQKVSRNQTRKGLRLL